MSPGAFRSSRLYPHPGEAHREGAPLRCTRHERVQRAIPSLMVCADHVGAKTGFWRFKTGHSSHDAMHRQ